jgi:hypothetical protein
MIVAPRSQRWLMRLCSNSAPVLDRGTKPGSSMISSSTGAICVHEAQEAFRVSGLDQPAHNGGGGGEAGQVKNQLLVQGRDGVEAEGFQALDGGDLRLPDPSVDPAGLAVRRRRLDQTRRIADMIDSLCRALLGQLLVFPEDRRQLQLFQVAPQQDLGGFGRGGHGEPPVTRLMQLAAAMLATSGAGKWG